MQRNIAFAVASVAAAIAAGFAPGNAFADDITIDTTPFVSTRSRADVQSELMRDSTNEWKMQFNEARAGTGYTRGQARADYVASRDVIKALDAEDSGSSYLARRPGGVNARAMGGPAR